MTLYSSKYHCVVHRTDKTQSLTCNDKQEKPCFSLSWYKPLSVHTPNIKKLQRTVAENICFLAILAFSYERPGVGGKGF